MNSRDLAKKIFLEGIKGVLPGKIIRNLISVDKNILSVGDQKYGLDTLERIYVAGAGKASAAMGHYVEALLGDRISGGLIITKYGHSCRLERIKVAEAGHPVPDDNSFAATRELIALADSAGENDLFIFLISGGGSALLADHPENCSPCEIAELNDLLVRSGADIREINTVRKHLSAVKGGNLVKHIWPAACCSIILSDVTGDPVDIIASGPTVPDDSSFTDALRILHNHKLTEAVTPAILDYLNEGAAGRRDANPATGDPVFSKTVNIVSGNIGMALDAARTYAEKEGFSSVIVTREMFGDPIGAARYIVDTALAYRNSPSSAFPACLLFGGETALKVTGNGLGGRNQHLALAAAMMLKDVPGVTVLAGGTDGNDGITEMAGAVVDSGTLISAAGKGINPESFLNAFDSYNFFKFAGGHVYTGPTMTNVMDMVIVIIE